jgi:hypothetical protein
MTDQKIKEAFRVLSQHQDSMTEFQVVFISGLKKYFTRNKTLTAGQQECLFQITTNLKTNDNTKTEKNDN